MPVALFDSEDNEVPMGTSLVIDDVSALLIGINSSGTIRVRYPDGTEDTEVDAGPLSLEVRGI